MSEIAPVEFTDEQLIAALKAAPKAVQMQVAVIAMQIELTERRAQDGNSSE